MFRIFLSLILLVPTISFANNFYLKVGVLSGDNELEEI